MIVGAGWDNLALKKQPDFAQRELCWRFKKKLFWFQIGYETELSASSCNRYLSINSYRLSEAHMHF